METTNTKNPPQHTDNEASSTRCLRISLIVRKVMQHVINAELLQVSNVNKLWNYEARSVMKDRGCFIARLKSGHPCKDLLALVSDMQLMNVVPFAGIAMSLDASHLDVCSLSTTPKLDSSHHKVLDQLTWKHLEAEFFSGHWALDTNCPAFRVVMNVLQKFCGNLERLSFRIQPFSAHCLEQAIQDCKFPRLKTLRYWDEAGSPDLYRAHGSFIHSVIARAGRGPVQLHMKNYVSHMERVLEGGNVELVACYNFYPDRHFFSSQVMAAIKLKRFTLGCHRQAGYLPFLSFNTIVPVLLKSSCTSLISLEMDLIHALPLMCYGTVLENLVDLRIDAAFSSLKLVQPHLLTLLRSFDFTQLCPRLTRVRVFLSHTSIPQDDITQFVEQANAPPRPLTAALDRAANIKHLSFSAITTPAPEETPFVLFAQVFPHIQKLSFETFDKRKAVFGIIWEHWAELIELEMRTSFFKANWPEKDSLATGTDNLDSEFCGIFPEEVAELREKDDEYLRTVNIVPVMPSITCMKNLRTFRMLCTKDVEQFGEKDPNFIFSKVTCLIAFARCPNLSVILETRSEKMAEALSHIKPYITAVVQTPAATWRAGTVVSWPWGS